ncbi:cold shock domain-containing protein [Candidatus Pacearchaeota archaeon]|nr:cold shock domain-containing protein [Candidatus Pacearchaeota archaeon]
MKGNVRFFDAIKGFGFITGKDGEDYFVHKSELKETDSLDENDEVSFDVEKGTKGLKAVNVKKE